MARGDAWFSSLMDFLLELLMTYRSCVGLAVMMLAAPAAQPLSAAEPTVTTLVRTQTSVKVDGKLDDAAWKDAHPIRVDYLSGQVNELSDAPRMIVRYAWDGDYLYLGYETFDANIVGLGNGRTDGPKGNCRDGCQIYDPARKADVVEFFISFGDERFFWELHHNAANQFNDVWNVVLDNDWPIAKSTYAPFGMLFLDREMIGDDVSGNRHMRMAVQLKSKADGKPSTLNSPDDKDTGYTAEIRIPWLGLGPPRDRRTSVTVSDNGNPRRINGPWKMDDLEIQILAVVQDGDLEQRYHHSSAVFPGGWFQQGASTWPRYLLKNGQQ